jgi:5-methylcytosine-specific restriction endonuclease McrA
MARKRSPLTHEQRAKVEGELRRDVAVRKAGYRAKALALFPHICASCGREFSGKRLRELTVHHKDHNFKNNPPDGSNWELLCLYCHDHEHEKTLDAKHLSVSSSSKPEATGFANPFENLGSLIGPEEGADTEPPPKD